MELLSKVCPENWSAPHMHVKSSAVVYHNCVYREVADRNDAKPNAGDTTTAVSDGTGDNNDDGMRARG